MFPWFKSKCSAAAATFAGRWIIMERFSEVIISEWTISVLNITIQDLEGAYFVEQTFF